MRWSRCRPTKPQDSSYYRDKKGEKAGVLLDGVIRANTTEIFGAFLDFDRHDAYSMKLTRDAEFGLEENIDASFGSNVSGGETTANRRASAVGS